MQSWKSQEPMAMAPRRLPSLVFLHINKANYFTKKEFMEPFVYTHYKKAPP